MTFIAARPNEHPLKPAGPGQQSTLGLDWLAHSAHQKTPEMPRSRWISFSSESSRVALELIGVTSNPS